MKFALSALALLTFPAFAFAEDFKSIYEDLDVKAVKMDDGNRVGSVAYVKKAGGLSCRERKAVVPNPKPEYHCTLKSTPASDAKVYAALRVEERNITPGGMLGSVTMQKESGDLVCTKSSAVVPHPKPSFHCALGAEEEGEDAYDHE